MKFYLFLKMTEIIPLLQDDIKFMRELFALDYKDSKTIIDMFINSMKNSPYGMNYYIQLLDVYSIARIKFLDVSKQVLDAVFNCFPELLVFLIKLMILPAAYTNKCRKTIYFNLSKMIMLKP